MFDFRWTDAVCAQPTHVRFPAEFMLLSSRFKPYLMQYVFFLNYGNVVNTNK